MKKIAQLLLGIVLITSSCKPKENIIKSKSCLGEIDFEYEWLKKKKEDRNHVIADRYSKYYAIKFVGEYKDSVSIYLNDNLQNKMYIEKDDNEDEHNYGFTFSHLKNPILKIESIAKKSCFNIKLDKKYPIIYVWLDKKGKWSIRFSNFYHSDNLKKHSH